MRKRRKHNCKWIFAILKIKVLKTPFLVVKRIRKRFLIKDTLNMKVGSGHHRAPTIKHDHRLKMTVLNGIRKRLLSTAKRNSFSRLTKSRRVKEMGFYQKYMEILFSVVNKIFPSRQSF